VRAHEVTRAWLVNEKRLSILVAVAAVLGSRAASAQLHVDAEVDPTAYALDGYSLHLGIGSGRVRLDLGVFRMAIPQLVHGDAGFDVSFDGFGPKLQYFLFAEQRGLFVGADAGLTRIHAERQGTSLAAHEDSFGLGIHAGYRVPLP